MARLVTTHAMLRLGGRSTADAMVRLGIARCMSLLPISRASLTTEDANRAAAVLPTPRRQAYNMLQQHASKKGKTKKKKKKKHQKKQKGGVKDMLPVTQAKSMFMLTDDALDSLPVMVRPNPQSASFADMRLYWTTQVLDLALESHGGASGFLHHALAARRRRAGDVSASLAPTMRMLLHSRCSPAKVSRRRHLMRCHYSRLRRP